MLREASQDASEEMLDKRSQYEIPETSVNKSEDADDEQVIQSLY